MWTKQRALLLVVLLLCGATHAATIGFQWGAVTYSEPIVYELAWGTASRDYSDSVTVTETVGTTGTIPAGVPHFFAVRACTENKVVCSPWSNEIEYTVGDQPPAPDNFGMTIVVFPPPSP